MKSLTRKKSDSFTVMPNFQIPVPEECETPKRNSYFGIIFAYNSTSVKNVISYFELLEPLPASYRPNAVVLYDKKTIIIQATDDYVDASPMDEFNKYVALKCREDILAIFIYLLINYTRFSLLKSAVVPNEIGKIMQMKLDENIKAGGMLAYEFEK